MEPKLTGKVLACAYLLQAGCADSFLIAINGMTPEEWAELKRYLRTGSFIHA